MYKQLYLTSALAALAVFLLPQPAHALTNFVGIEAGVRANGLSITTVDSTQSPVLGGGGGSCAASDYVDDGTAFIGPGALPGPREYAPDLNTWSDFAYHGYCKYPLAFGLTASFGDNLHVGYLWLYLAGKNVPKETDIRVCLQARTAGVNGTKECTPWASELAASTWGDSDFAYDSDKKNAETFRIRVESRAMLGRSITDVRLRMKMIDVGTEANWITTKWSSNGGGWAQIWRPDPENAYYLPTGSTGEYGDGAKVGMMVRVANSPVPDLTASGVVLNSGSTIQGSAITVRGTITNNGTLSTGVGFSNVFQYRWSSTDPWTTIGSPIAMPALAVGATQTPVSSSFTLNNSGNLEIRLVADSSNVVSELDEADNVSSITIPISPPPTPNIVPLSVVRTGTTVVGQPQTFTGTVRNIGTGASLSSTATRFCYNNSSCATNSTNAFASPSAPILSAGGTSGPLTGTWTPTTAGTYTVYYCVVNKSCVNTGSFTINNPPPATCNINGNTVTQGPVTLYSANPTPNGESCTTGVDTSGRSFDHQFTCNSDGSVSGAGPGTNIYTHRTCTPGVVPPPPPPEVQGPISLSSNESKVRKDSEVRLTWDGSNSTTCTLSGTNGFTLVSTSGTNVLSGPISQKTVFTLTCTLGASTKQATLTVDIVAAVKEI